MSTRVKIIGAIVGSLLIGFFAGIETAKSNNSKLLGSGGFNNVQANTIGTPTTTVSLIPTVDNTQDVGSAGNSWRDIWLGRNLQSKTNNTASLGTYGQSFATEYVSSTSFLQTVLASGNINASSSVFLSGVATTTPTSIAISSSVIPGTNGAFDIGSSPFAMRNGYFNVLYVNNRVSPGTNNTNSLGQYGEAFANIYASSTSFLTSIQNSAGSSASPSYSFASSTNSGIYWGPAPQNALFLTNQGNNIVGVVSNGVGPLAANTMDLGAYNSGQGLVPWRNVFASSTVYSNVSVTGNGAAGTPSYTFGTDKTSGWWWNPSPANALEYSISGSAVAAFTGNNIAPLQNNAIDLGSYNSGQGTFPFRNLFVSSTAHLNTLDLLGNLTPSLNNTSNIGSFSTAVAGIFASSSNIYFSGLGAPGVTDNVMCWGADGKLFQQATNCTVSDLRKKTNITDWTLGLDIIRNLHPINYDEKNGGLADQIGLGAQDVAKVDPHLAVPYKVGEVGYPGWRTVDYMKLTIPLINSVKELDDKIQTQQDEIDSLKLMVFKLSKHKK